MSERKEFSCAVKIDTLVKQELCCNNPDCHKGFLSNRRPQFDHISGSDDNSIDNCQALCPNCHDAKNVDENREESKRLKEEKE